MKAKNAKQQLKEEIKVENLTVSKFYYIYFPFKKDVFEERTNTNSLLVVRRKKNAEDIFEIVDRIEIYEKALIDKIEEISCVVEKMNDSEARLYSLEAALASRTLTVMQAIACRQEILCLDGECSPATVIHMARKTSPATYRRAYESFIWFQGKVRAEIFTSLTELTDIEIVARCIDHNNNIDFGELNSSQREMLLDFEKIYFDNDPKMKVNTFHKKYYKGSVIAEENQRTYPFKNTVWKRKAKKIVENLICSSAEFVALIQQEGKNNLADELIKAVMDDKSKVSAIAALSQEFVKITNAVSKKEIVEDNPVLFD
jgi:hypothetical protein